MARNTIKTWLRKAGVTEPRYPKREVATKLDAYAETLGAWLKADSHRGMRERRTVWMMFQDLRALGDVSLAVTEKFRQPVWVLAEVLSVNERPNGHVSMLQQAAQRAARAKIARSDQLDIGDKRREVLKPYRKRAR